jgi:hypothetical protein
MRKFIRVGIAAVLSSAAAGAVHAGESTSTDLPTSDGLDAIVVLGTSRQDLTALTSCSRLVP